MAWTGLTLTVDGRNALNQAQAANQMNIKSIVVGDGSPPSNFRTMKGLVHQLFEVTDLKLDVVDNRCVLTADFPKVDYDYYFREIGVVVTTEEGDVLYVYDNCGDDAQYVVTSTGVEDAQKRIRISLLISDVADITVMSPSILYVGFDEFEAEVEKLQQAKEDITQLQEQTAKLETGKVDKAGDTMSGALYVEGNVTASEFVGKSTSTDKWDVPCNINGMNIDGTANACNYATCSTASATAEKIVSCKGFELVAGAEITVKFTVTNTAANPTMNVNDSGAKPIYYRGAAISSWHLAANRTRTFRYNGSQYEVVGDLDTNATYNVATTSANGLMSKEDKAKLDGMPEKFVTGVKGAAETEYRGGNVNLTPENIGALSLSGGGVDGSVSVVGSVAVGENARVRLWEDDEGGNISIVSPDKYGDRWEMDAYDGSLRFVDFSKDGSFSIPVALSDSNVNIYRTMLLSGTANSPSVRWQDDKRTLFAGTANGGGDFYIYDTTNKKSVLLSKADGTNSFNGTAAALTSNAGSATQPVYFSGGKPAACSYTLGKSVPGNAVFTDTNTWRGIQNNLTSTSTTESLSANQGRLLANGSARDGTKLPLTGGTMAGGLNFNYNGTLTQISNAADSGIISTNKDYIKLLVGNQVYIQHGADQNYAWAGCSAGGFFTVNNSSEKIKENIEDVSEERAKQILDVRVITFDYKEGVIDERYRYDRTGVAAEPTEKVCPEVINYDDGIPSGVQYDRFIPYLIKMVQIQQKEIDTLKEEKENLDKRLSVIEKSLGIAT